MIKLHDTSEGDMNDLIKELADKAQEYAEWETPQGLEWLDNFKEQFARLIIQECTDICDGYGMPDGTSPVAAILSEAIKRKFGVE